MIQVKTEAQELIEKYKSYEALTKYLNNHAYLTSDCFHFVGEIPKTQYRLYKLSYGSIIVTNETKRIIEYWH